MEGIVHGDLRPYNIMCRELPGQGKEKGELEIKVIDFDRAGKVGEARYPVGMNPDIPSPGNSRDLIGEEQGVGQIIFSQRLECFCLGEGCPTDTRFVHFLTTPRLLFNSYS